MKTVRMIVFLWIIIAISNWLTTRSVHTALLQMLISAALLSLTALINVACRWRRGRWSYERRFGRLHVSAYGRAPLMACKAQAYRRRPRGRSQCSR